MLNNLSELHNFLGAVLDAVPSPIFVVDEDVRVHWANRAGSRLLSLEPERLLRRRAGDLLHCLHSLETPEGCGTSAYCADCPVRAAVTQAFQGRQAVRRQARMEMVQQGHVTDIHLLVTTAPFAFQDSQFVLLTLEDVSELMQLRSCLPICAYCKKIRTDKAYWQSLEVYFKTHLDVDFTHGICPECAADLLAATREKAAT